MESDSRLESDLESFRRQWRSEIQHKPRGATGAGPSAGAFAATSTSRTTGGRAEAPKPTNIKKQDHDEHDEYYIQAQAFDERPAPSSSGRTLEGEAPSGEKQLVSALDHFEEAVEKEAIGNLGDSLRLYRKAFRMDERVDLQYRKKHFPGRPAAPKQPPFASHQTTPRAAAAEATKAKTADEQPLSISDLIASFSGLAVAAAPAPVEGEPPPPCPISELPQEILTHIFTDLAVLDVADFARLSLVCKRFAYLVATDDQVWRHVCYGREFGFQGMHYHWQKGVSWEPLPEEGEVGEEGEYVTMEELVQRRREESLAITTSLLPDYSNAWQHMFRRRPRIRFNGCYISTVNYIRAGQASTNQITWNSPVHIITYYRYLRFFRDGTVISLLATSEPGDVVHYLTKELVAQHRDRPAQNHLPSAVMQQSLRGRWRLSSVLDHPDGTLTSKDAEGDLFVETEGVGSKYMYKVNLSLRSAGRGARNNKLIWKGFWSYNKLTDDWAEFGLKNDKPFYFSRVRSYGIGE